MIRILFKIVTLMLACVSAVAQEVQEDEICVSVAHIWHGTLADMDRIKAEPIPESFRERFEGTGCSRWSLVETSLLDWHAKYGDAETMAAAVDYITMPARKALTTNLSKDPVWLQMAHTTLAYYYRRAAQGFNAEALYRKAADHSSRALAAHDVDPWPNLDAQIIRPYRDDQSTDMGIRSYYAKKLQPWSAAIHAELAWVSRDEKALVNAENLLANDILESATQWVLREKKIECEYDKDRSDDDEDGCDIVEDGRLYLLDYTRTKAIIEASKIKAGLVDTNSDGALYDAEFVTKLYNIEEDRYSIFHRHAGHSGSQTMTSLYFAYGEASFSRAAQADDNTKQRSLYKCTEYADLAAQYSPPHQMPSQWKRAAELYVKCARTLQVDELWPGQQIALRYFEQALSD